MSESKEPLLDPMPGSRHMPPWTVGTLPEAPPWSLRNWTSMIGPGLLTAGAAIGGGEWLMGPVNTARYGGGILWVTTLSILAQVLYNIEISRYTLYTGEPIMNGKFRTAFMNPLGWFVLYMILDLGSLIPYQAASTAVPVVALFRGDMPPTSYIKDTQWLFIGVGCAIYVLAAVPLVFAGKIYSFIKALMTFKIIFVFACLIFLTVFHVSGSTWIEVLTGFFKFGNVPVEGNRLENVFGSVLSGRGLPNLDSGAFAALAAYAAIAGIGGLKNTMISSYTRDQGWGMGSQVGAIPSMFGGRSIELSHTGKVFTVDDASLPRWRRWMSHMTREQMAIWMTGAMVGVALPAMLSVQFLAGKYRPGESNWVMAGLTAQGIRDAVPGGLGTVYWYMLILCGILILVPNTVTDADSTVRRWVDLAWTSVKRLRAWDPRRINLFYFWMLVGYVALGVVILWLLPQPKGLVEIYGCIANFALGFSCFHVLWVNLTLLPKAIQPRWFNRVALSLSGCYFFTLSIMTFVIEIRKLRG